MDPQILFLLAALIGAGLFAGLVAGLFGVGGGVVIVPAVYYAQAALGYPEETRMHVAVATSLATIIATSIRSVMAHNKKGAVDWQVLRAWSPWIVLGALAGAFVADMTPGRALTAFFGAVAMLIAAQIGREHCPEGCRCRFNAQRQSLRGRLPLRRARVTCLDTTALGCAFQPAGH